MSSRAARVLAENLIASPTSPVEMAKRLAARKAVDDYVKSGMDVGIGSGSTIVYGIQRLAERVWGEERLSIRCVPTSFQSKQLCSDAGIPLTELSPSCPSLDVTIDGADEVDPSLDCIKGGGGCQTLEKVVAAAASTFVVVVDYSKRSDRLLTVWRKGIPVEVLALALTPVEASLRAMGGKPVLRMGAPAKAGPAVTDNGNLILDVDFGGGAGLLEDPALLHTRIKGLPGVVETGIFPGMIKAVIYGEKDGTITMVERKQ